MPGRIDPRVLAQERDGLIPFKHGLDLTSGSLFAQAGSLREAVNVEFVNGTLQISDGTMLLGSKLLNSIPKKIYTMTGTEGVDWTVSGAFNQHEIVDWYATAFETVTPVGSGVVAWTVFSAPHVYGLAFVEGEPPSEGTYFVGRDSGSALTTVSAEFNLPDPQFTEVTAQVWRRAHSLFAVNSLSDVNTWNAFRSRPGGYGAITHLFQQNDKTYAGREFLGLYITAGEEEPSIGDKVSYDNEALATVTAYIYDYELISGSWEDGDAEAILYLYPKSDSTLDGSSLYPGSGETVTNSTTTNTLGSSETLVGGGSRYADPRHTLLWELDTSSRVNSGWRYLDMGFSVQFNGGLVAPLAQEAPIFVTDSVEAIQDTGFIAFQSPGTEFPSTGTYSAWSGLSNLAADDASNATSTIAATDLTRVLELAVSTSIIPGDAKITGIEVSMEVSASASSSVYLERLELRNDTTQSLLEPQYLPTNRAEGPNNLVVTTSPVVYTFGGQLDLWGHKEITADDLNAGDYSLLVQFGNSNGSSRDVTVDYVLVKVHYIQTGQSVYFYDGSSDVDSGTLYAYQVMDGEWSTDDAQGWMTVKGLTNPSSIYTGTQIRTAASGAGDLIAEVVEVTPNRLPSYEQMKERESRCQHYAANIGGGSDDAKVFVVNGVTPAFSVDVDNNFQFIRTPVDRDKDRPRYVSEIQEHLVLALDEHIVVSSVGAPNNFSTYDGATTWAVGEQITGLVQTPDNSLQVLSKSGIRRLSGSGATGQDAFKLIKHSSAGGIKPYSAVEAGDVLFFDSHGLTALSTTDRFGDFLASPMAQGVEPWLKPRLNERSGASNVSSLGLLEVVKVRSKGQIRAFFNDGFILTVTLPRAQDEPARFTMQHYRYTAASGGWILMEREWAPSALSSYVTSWGEEILLIGNEAGYVMRAEVPSGLHGRNGFFVANIITNPITIDGIGLRGVKSTGVNIVVEADYDYSLAATQGIDFKPPGYVTAGTYASSNAVAKTLDQTETYYQRYDTFIATLYDNELTDGISWHLMSSTTTSNNVLPVRFLGLSPQTQAKGGRASRVQRAVSTGSTGL